MEEIKKTDEKVGQRSFLKPLLIILALVILLGGGFLVYTNYYQNSSTPEPVTTITPTTTATNTAAVWETYTNINYDFSVALSDAFSGYVVKEVPSTSFQTRFIRFYMPTTDTAVKTDASLGGKFVNVFNIVVYTPSQWAVVQAAGDASTQDLKSSSTYINKNSDYVFVYTKPSITATDLKSKDFGLTAVAASFKFVTSATTGWNIYTNLDYSFSFKYPKEWASTKVEATTEPAQGTLSKDLVFKVSFQDPDMALKISCIDNESQNWRDATPTKTTCDPILLNMTTAQKDSLSGPKSPNNIFVRIYNKTATTNLSDWLYATFHQPNTELENYQVGSAIKLAGLDGYFSSIGCCGGVDRSYAVTSGGYVYDLGSNYFVGSYDNETMPDTFQKVAKTFTITK